jgi:gliding motility-associated-like protein
MPTISTDGYTGNWAIEIIDPFGQGNASIENIFTPDPGQGACLDEFIGNIEIESELLIEFDIPALCELDDPFVLPSISDNGITGIWTPAVIDPLSLGGTVFSASFQPDALFCAQEYFLDLNIDPADIPEFSLPTVLCEFDDALILPTISDNGVLGMWTDAIIDPTGEGGQTLSSVFIPDDQLFECMEIYTYNVFINPGIVPTFTTVDPLCETDPAFYPDTISLNGVEGQWDPAFIIPADHPDETLVLTFNPNATSCASVTELILDVVSTPEILTLDESNPTDCGSSDGQIIIEAQGTNLEYSIDGGINWNTNADFPNLSGGTYNIQIRSSLNHTCIIEDQVILISPGAPQIDEVITTDPSDCGLEDGSIEIEAAGTSLEYSIDGGNNWQGSNIFQMLAPGDYDIRIREAGSPSCVSSSTALIEEHPGVTLTDVLITDVSNCSVADGQLAILALGENLEYSIDSGSSWQSEPIFTDLDSGSYQIYVRASDATLCSDDSVASIGAPVPPVIDDILTTDPGDCAASDGSILVKMIGSDYEYSIDNGINWQSDSLFNDLPSGLYEISVRWANAIACIDEGTVSLYEPELPVINNISVFAPTDCGLADGRAIISATGDNLEYSIDNGVNWQSDSIFNMLAAGNYLIKVRTANAIGCEAEEMIAISSVNSPEILELNLEHVSDCGLSDGSIDISASGIDLEYSLDSISWQSSQIFENLDAGNYTVYTRSQSQPACLSFGLAIIEGPVYPQIVAVQVDSVSDCGQADARITIDANGESLEYSIDGGTTWQDNFEFVGLPAGIYDIQVREKGTLSCVDIAEVIFEDPDCDCGDITFDIESSDVSCYGMEDGSISILNVKGSDDYLISWNTGAQGNSVSGLSPGVYAFNIEYDKNCLFSDSIEINEPPVITFDTGVSPADCPGSPSGSIAVLNASGGFGQLLYSINNSIATADPLLTNLTNGEYEVGVVDENGCISSSIVQVGAENALIIELQELVESVLGDTIKLNPIVDLSRVDSFHWIPDPLQYNPANLSATFLVEEAGDVLLSVYYGSCIANAVSKIQINNQDIYVPSAFSPNNDGVNDRFFISADPVLSELTYQLQIYNRWGGKLFENPSARINHPEDGWDGKLNDKELLPGAYLYLIQITDQSGKVITRSGDVVIVR